MASNESSKIKLVLIGKLPIKNSDKMMKIWVNPNNVTHVKSVIRPVWPHGDPASYTSEPEDYLEIGTFIFVTTQDTAAVHSRGSIFGVTTGINSQVIFTNLYIQDVIEILNGSITYEDIPEDRIIKEPDKDILDRLGQAL